MKSDFDRNIDHQTGAVMKDFAGFDDWVEVFTGGPQTDSQGRRADGDWLIDRALATFDPAHHEPPLVVGHPKDNSPAFGWVEAIRPGQRGGRKTLLARFKQLNPDFVELAKSGAYKKRSASFYADGRLRHVGFLGGSPPAVKGLADIQFTAEPAADFIQDFNEEKKMDIKEFFEGLKFWKESGAMDVGAAREPHPAGHQNGPEKQADGASFSEADIRMAREEAAAAEREKLTREFAEKAAQTQREARGEAIKAEIMSLVESGKIPPFLAKSGLVEFMQALDADQTMDFGEEKGKTQLDWFRGMLGKMQPVVSFTEHATRDKDVSGASAEKLNQLIQAKIREKAGITYGQAFAEVQMEAPDLVREYHQEMNR